MTNITYYRLDVGESLRSPSIAPSDSISHFAPHSENRSHPQPIRTVHQPATRPSRYPVEILWTLEDCKDDPDVRTSPTNMSRPPMEQAIRHEDGTMISLGEWAAIKATGRLVKMDLLSLPPPRDRRAKGQKKTKTYFRTFYRKEWDAAIDKMESQQPLLTFCAAHWKADHVLGSTLLVPITTGNLDNTGDEGDELDAASESAKPTESTEGKKLKRPADRHSRKAKKAKTGKDTARTKIARDASLSNSEHGMLSLSTRA
jgi:hypothetical protein